ncbi:hypothetical protein GQ54DRAFT_297514 [Martensiomyces pterosporus]|nr:hypothetical protein GQ54DRAFT_297514 [Martensiomyces pterosporus]
MSGANTILDWATQFYCSRDDHEIVGDLLELRRCSAADAGADQNRTPPPRGRRHAKRDEVSQLDDGKQPLHILFYKIRRSLRSLGPSYLGLDETEKTLDDQQSLSLNLHIFAKPALDAEAGAGTQQADSSAKSDGVLEPFSSAFDSCPSSGYPQTLQTSPPIGEPAETEPLDIPALIYSLITIENARRHFASEVLSRKHSEGSKIYHSERWQHGFAKRNLAAETNFENVLVALKELVVLRAIADPDTTQIGELNLGLGRTSSRERRRSRGAAPLSAGPSGAQGMASSAHLRHLGHGFDAAQCLAILNLMFPLDPLHADRRQSMGTNMWQQRYAFPLQHVPNPRAQLHQLLCEVEAWVNCDERVATAMRSSAILKNSSAIDALPHTADPVNLAAADRPALWRTEVDKNDSEPHLPTNCPAWLASARGFAWGRIKQSCVSYLQATSQKIAEQHRMVYPWAPACALPANAAADAPDPLEPAGHDTHSACSQEPTTPRAAGLDIGRNDSLSSGVWRENRLILKGLDEQLAPNTTVIERIVHHSRAISRRFSPYSAYETLSK